MRQFIETNGIWLSYLDHPGPGETLVLMHGLTVNAHFFDGLIDAGLNQHIRVISVDLRGRGQSDKPEDDYAISEHAADIIGLLDALGLEQVVLGGHSFGGMVTMFAAAHHPERFKKLVIMDAAAGVARPEIVEAIKPSLDRLAQTLPSLDAYIAAMKQLPYYHDGFWDEALEAYYRADVEVLEDGSVRTWARPEHMKAAISAILEVDWLELIPSIPQPAILINAVDPLGPPGSAVILTAEDAQKTVNDLANCTYHQVSGHHITMMFAEHARQVNQIITEFVAN